MREVNGRVQVFQRWLEPKTECFRVRFLLCPNNEKRTESQFIRQSRKARRLRRGEELVGYTIKVADLGDMLDIDTN